MLWWTGWPDIQTEMCPGGELDLIYCMTSLPKEVSALGRWSLKQDGDGFIGTGMMVEALQHVGTAAWLREVYLPEHI